MGLPPLESRPVTSTPRMSAVAMGGLLLLSDAADAEHLLNDGEHYHKCGGRREEEAYYKVRNEQHRYRPPGAAPRELVRQEPNGDALGNAALNEAACKHEGEHQEDKRAVAEGGGEDLVGIQRRDREKGEDRRHAGPACTPAEEEYAGADHNAEHLEAGLTEPLRGRHKSGGQHAEGSHY